MSDLILNLRVGMYHLQINYKLAVKVTKNEAHRGYPDGFFALYEFSPSKFFL